MTSTNSSTTMTNEEIAANLKLALPGLSAAVNSAADREAALESRIEDAQTAIDNCQQEIKDLQQQVEQAQQQRKEAEEAQGHVEELIEVHTELHHCTDWNRPKADSE